MMKNFIAWLIDINTYVDMLEDPLRITIVLAIIYDSLIISMLIGELLANVFDPFVVYITCHMIAMLTLILIRRVYLSGKLKY